MRRLFDIDGGIGRCLMFTGVIDKFKELNPDTEVNVLTGLQDLFFNSPSINRTYPFMHQYLWEDVISKMQYMKPEPYTMFEYYNQGKHFINCLNILVNGKDEFVKPNIYINEMEDLKALELVGNQKRDVVLFQPFGALGGRGNDESFRSLRSDFAQKLANKIKEKYDIFQVKDNSQKALKDIPFLSIPVRTLISVIPYVRGVVGIDSFLQHASFAMGKKAFVFWTTTRESNLGYPTHTNVRNGKELYWSPIRMLCNNPDMFKKNKGIDEFSDDYIDKVMEYIENEKGSKNGIPSNQSKCSGCKG